MIKRILGAALAALALTFGALTLAAPAQAIPEIQLPWTVTFSADDCTGLTKVTLANNITRAHIGLVFTVNGDEVTVDPDSTEVVNVAYPASLHTVVDLTGAFDADPEIETAAKADLVIVKHWTHDWQRPAGCWKVAVVSHCNGDQALSVTNTAPDAADFTVQVDTTEAVLIHVAGLATFTATYPGKPTVSVTVDKETTSTFAFKSPVCPTPVPTPTPTPVVIGGGDVLPVTGQDLSTRVAVVKWTGLGLGLIGAGVLVGWLVRRRRQAA